MAELIGIIPWQCKTPNWPNR